MDTSDAATQPHLVITEQPHPRALRFRYKSENRGLKAGSIIGVNSTDQCRTHPAFEVRGYSGPAKIIVSCVTTEDIPRLHPHHLVGRDGCHDGVCDVYVSPETNMACSIANLGIQCVLRKEVDKVLSKRVQPYENPFGVPPGDSSTINLNEIRLCFQLFIKHSNGQYVTVEPPVVSSTIFDKKANPPLEICALSECWAPICGGKKITLLTTHFNKNDIRVGFFHDRGPHRAPWRDYGTIQLVHKQVAIVVETPPYDDLLMEHSVQVKIYLQQVNGTDISDAHNFELRSDLEDYIKREKYARSNNWNQSEHIFSHESHSSPLSHHTVETPSTLNGAFIGISSSNNSDKSTFGTTYDPSHHESLQILIPPNIESPSLAQLELNQTTENTNTPCRNTFSGLENLLAIDFDSTSSFMDSPGLEAKSKMQQLDQLETNR